ncbi:heavy metal translocatin [Lyophyllum atratum]|nr:heavy metal translocatin [Lyophyllum atratum]
MAAETLQLEIRGMDCASCMPKVGRALEHLPSVTPINLDYFSGTANLRYDPDTITTTAIIAYVARATGFGVKALSGESGGVSATTVTLSLLFSSMPPSEAFDDFDTQICSNPHIIEISFPVDAHNSRRPREVLQQFKPFGAALVPPGKDGNLDMAMRDLISVGFRTLACAILSIPVLVLAWAKLPSRPILYGAISAGFTTLIQALAFPIISSACRSVVYLHQADMSVFVAISTLTAYLFSIISYAFEVSGRPFATAFFETSALLVTLIFLGRTMSAATRRSTGSALRELQKLQPTDVLLLSDGETRPQSIDSRLLYYGDIIRIPPETRIATDGLVVAGSSDVDESSITGESVALSKRPGSRLIAGTLNLGGTLDVQVTRLTHENSLSRITSVVRQAQSSRSPIQHLSDRLAAMILPVAAAAACIAFLVWVFVGRYGRHQSATTSSVNALTYAIAILAISCPCAIGLAVPVVVSVAIRIGIREGILFHSADALETTRHINVIAFDKTGTLSQGKFTVERAEILVEGAEWVVDALVKDNKHPISQGVHRLLSARLSAKTQLREGALVDIVSLPGKGIKASLSGFTVLGGSADFTCVSSHPLYSDLCSSGLTVFTVTLGGQPIAFFGLADTPRPDASALVAELTRRGKDVIILSGDTPSAVHYLATAIGIPLENTYPACSPEDKDAAIAALQAKGRKVRFVGDGTNDGPALSRADMALAIGGGSDVALTAASAVLLGSDLHRGVIALLDISKAARMHARLALVWCLLYNVFAILLASGVLIKFRIEPRWAGIGEVVSIVPVFAVGLGLDLRWRWRRLYLAAGNSN